MAGHLCTCEDCHPEAFDDQCAYETVAGKATALLEHVLVAKLGSWRYQDEVRTFLARLGEPDSKSPTDSQSAGGEG